MPETTVYKTKNGQFKVTIPNQIGEGMDLEGEKVEWKIASRKSLKMKVKK